MRYICFKIGILFALIGCTLAPKPLDGLAEEQSVNRHLICAKQIDIQPVSINGAMAPKAAFNHAMKNLRNYTTPNVKVHQTVNLTLSEDQINYFIHDYGQERDLSKLTLNDKEKFLTALKELPRNSKSNFIMIYTPTLSMDYAGTDELRGIAFYNRRNYNVVAYNETTINGAPVLTDTQAWKIVLTHEFGHQFKVPAKETHNREGHCTSRECIMYASPDWQSVVSVLFNGMPYDFCQYCRAELEEAKESCSE